MNKMIEVNGLHKSYGKIHAVRGIDFYVEEGKIFAFLGPNGAGKSTTIDIICTFLKPDSGSVTVGGYRLGENDSAIRNIIGAVFQDGLLDNLLTVEENLRIRGGFYGLDGRKLKETVIETAKTTGISDIMKRPYGSLSGGQRRRCDIARALVNTPEILFLDEPTTGLDPQTRKSVWETITGLQKKNNMTVFLTTHYMEEAAAADYVIVIDDGKIAAKGTPAALKEKYSSDKLILVGTDIKMITAILDRDKADYTVTADQVMVKISCSMDSLPLIEKCRPYITGFEVLSGTMDDAFIAITGKEIRG